MVCKKKNSRHTVSRFSKKEGRIRAGTAKGERKMMARCMVVLLFVVVFVALCCFHVSGQD